MSTPTLGQERRRPRSGLVGPTILIGLGVIFLLNNLGILGWEVWGALLRLWPLALIAVGLDLMFGRRSILGSLLVVVLMLAVAGGALWYLNAWPGTAPGLTTEAISQPIGQADRANVSITMGVGSLSVGALTESSDLIAGTISHSSREQLVREFNVSGGVASYALRVDGKDDWAMSFDNRGGRGPIWDLRLNTGVPMQLNLATGAGQSTIDLERLRLENLKISTGVGQTTITLPQSGRLSAKIDGGVGQTTIKIPAGMAARVTASAGIGQVRMPDSFSRQDRTYTSPGYDTAENQIELTVSGGIGSIVVQQLSGR